MNIENALEYSSLIAIPGCRLFLIKIICYLLSLSVYL